MLSKRVSGHGGNIRGGDRRHAVTLLDERTAIFADVLPESRVTSLTDTSPHDWTWINWTLSLLTAPAAALLMSFALARAADAALCTSAGCLAAGGPLFDLLYYGAAGTAALTLFLAFFCATHRGGIVVWMLGWILLLADLAVLVAVF